MPGRAWSPARKWQRLWRAPPVTEVDAAWEQFLEDWSSLSRLNVSRQVIEQASLPVWDFPLRGYDAVHLASAILWRETLETEIIAATYDRELWSAANNAGLSP